MEGEEKRREEIEMDSMGISEQMDGRRDFANFGEINWIPSHLQLRCLLIF